MLAATVVLCSGLMTGVFAGDNCGHKEKKGAKTSLDKIEVQPGFTSKKAKLDYYKTVYEDVSHEKLVKLIESEKAVIIDVNDPKQYAKVHVTGAVNFYNLNALARALPEDKSALTIVYCGSPKCAAWIDAAAFLTAQGYTNVKHYSAGIKGWAAKMKTSTAGKG